MIDYQHSDMLIEMAKQSYHITRLGGGGWQCSYIVVYAVGRRRLIEIEKS